MSSTTTWGRVSRMRPAISVGLAARPTTSTPGTEDRTLRTPSRTRSSSSTTTTFRGARALAGGASPRGRTVTNPIMDGAGTACIGVLSGVFRVPAPPRAPVEAPTRLLVSLEEEQHGCHPLVDVHLLREPELAEDGVDVLLHGPLGQDEVPGDGGVVATRGHEAEDLVLALGQALQAGGGPAALGLGEAGGHPGGRA